MKSLKGIFCVTAILLGCSAFAQGDLLITPKRILFDGRNAKEEINIVNTGNDTASYSISFLQYRMQEDGSFQQISVPDSGQLFADPYLRIFPRNVTLAPREAQVVSLQCRRTADMQPGEYRSHLYFRSEKNIQPLSQEVATQDAGKLKIQLIPIFGISIPVLIQSGEVHAIASLTSAKLETAADQSQFVNATLSRQGNMGLYGDISVEFIPEKGATEEVGRLANVGVYTTVEKRMLHIKLKRKLDLRNNPGMLKVKFVSKTNHTDTVQAEKEIILNAATASH